MMNTKRIILLGDGWGAHSAYKGLLSMGKPVYVISQDNFFKDNVLNISLDECEKDLLVFAGYKPIVPESVLGKNICINIHYSLLPQYRGFHSTVWAILNGEKYLGLTVHLMDKYIDNGPIIHQYKVENDFKSTSTDYMNQFNLYIENHLGSIIQEYLQGQTNLIIQDKKAASWVGKRNLQDCKIDFSQSIEYQKAFFRALVSPYPLPYIVFRGEKLIVRQVAYYESSIKTHIGRILNIDEEGIWVKIFDGYIILQKIQNEYGDEVSHDSFKIGQYLE